MWLARRGSLTASSALLLSSSHPVLFRPSLLFATDPSCLCIQQRCAFCDDGGLTLWVGRSDSRVTAFLLIAWSSGNIFWDGLFHVLTTVWFDRYSPGLLN